MTHFTRPLFLAALLAASLAPGAARACDEAERLRLSDELSSLAQKNAWAGVERKYLELKRTKCELKYDQHSIGAESAKNLGKTFEIWERLQAATAIEAEPVVTAAIQAIEENYGRVEIRGDARHRAPLLRDEMPFAPDQRKSIEYAMSVMEGTGSFKGMLPVGTYKVADKEFAVSAGSSEWQIVAVGKGKPVVGPDETGPAISDQGLINWVGPIAFAGAGYFSSPEPAIRYVKDPTEEDLIFDTPVVQGQDRTIGTPDDCGSGDAAWDFDQDSTTDSCRFTERQAAGFATPNIELTVGGEVGLTYKAPEAGVVGAITYRRLVGNSLNQFTLWGAGVVRPGNLRIVAGPTYSMVVGKATGFATWVDEGQSDDFDNRKNALPVPGLATGGGFAGSVGYALFDLGESLQGVVEAHGHFQFDGWRSYSGIGLRVGIVPKVKRFEG